MITLTDRLTALSDRETTRSRLRIVQFHPSLAYEDFVRGWRPAGDGRLALVDGILMEAIEAAASEPDRPFVLVVEEIIEETIRDGRAWFQAKVETEIGPLLDEYWYDAPETAKAARAKLLARLV